MAWDTEVAAQRAGQAYSFVARTLPPGSDYSRLASCTEAAYEAERAGDWPAYLDALRELMKAAKREARSAA
jgi:hypothetical protein